MERSSARPPNVLSGLLVEPGSLPRVGATIWPLFEDAFYSERRDRLLEAGLAPVDADLAILTFKHWVDNPGEQP